MMEAVSLEAVIKSDYPLVIRDAASRLSQVEYLTIGDFLKELSGKDLKDLNDRCIKIASGLDTEVDFDSIMLLSTMLSQAEGNSLEVPAAIRTSNLMILITLETLYRKNVIHFHRQYATLADEHLNDDIAKLK